MVFSNGSLALLLLAAAPSAYAFSQPKVTSTFRTQTQSRSTLTSLLQSTISPEAPAGIANGKQGDASKSPTSWDCDDDANCKEVAACDEEKCRTSLDVRINGDWYDLTGWRKAHPAGDHWIDYYDGRDATEVMDAFHSEKGRKMYQRLPKSKTETAAQLELTAEPDSTTQLNFRQLRADLEQEGWWERDMKHEFTLLGIFASLVITAVATAHSIPLLSTGLLGLAMTNAGK
jgi:cytochrome b involved in lipid metabolism